MSHVVRSFGSMGVIASCFAAAAIAACSGTTVDAPPLPGGDAPGAGGSSSGGTGGTSTTGGTLGTGGSSAVSTGGTTASGVGGTSSAAGGTAGGSLGAGGSSGGMHATGGTGTGGTFGATGGSAGTKVTGGTFGRGGKAGIGGSGVVGTGGSVGTGGAGAVSTGTAGASGDPCATTTVPSGGMQHSTNNASGMAAGLAWTIWSNGSGGSITTYSTPAFSAAWNNSGDFLARIGLQWNDTKTYDQYGTITAQYSQTKKGSGGGYSYIGIYGWSTSPCIEWYIVDDSFNKMPVNPGNTTNKGTAMIDGGSYTFYSRPTTGTGGSKCSGVSSWTQFYSVRSTSRTCGTISISQHFAAWAAAGMTLGKMDQAQILVEVGGGSGSIDFPVANITTTM
jgi:hypothetical protein